MTSPTKWPAFNWQDPLLLDEQLIEEERLVKGSAEAYAQAYNVDSMQADAAAAAAADAADAAVILEQAISEGANRDALVQHSFGLLESMAEAARRRERIPIPKTKKPKKNEDPPAHP